MQLIMNNDMSIPNQQVSLGQAQNGTPKKNQMNQYVPVHPHFLPSNQNLNENIIASKYKDENTNNGATHTPEAQEPIKITDDEGNLRYLSKSKMSSRGPVKQEFTLEGSTPSGKPRLFVCSTCTRAFARQEHLKRHERSHTKEKPFTCNICSRKFSRRDLLLRHSTKLHAGAADIIPRLRKRSIKHMKKEELEKLSPEDLSVYKKQRSAKSSAKSQISKPSTASMSTASNSISTSVSQLTDITNDSIKPPSLIGKVLKSLTPPPLRNIGSVSTSARTTASASSSASSSSTSKNMSNKSINVDSNSENRKRRQSSENSLILEKSNSLSQVNQNSVKNTNTNLNNTLNKHLSNDHSLFNNFQFPLYPLHDAQLNSIGDFSDIASSMVTMENLNDNENNFDRFNELQSNSYNYYRRASFSAMSGINYALTNPEPYASETVEFSTPQFNNLEDEQEKWLNSLSETNISPKGIHQSLDDNNTNNIHTNHNDNTDNNSNNNYNGNGGHFKTEIEQLNDFINNKNQRENYFPNIEVNHNHEILNGYSFYDDATNGITESLFHTRLNEPASNKSKIPIPFKSTSPLMQDESMNLDTKSNNKLNANTKYTKNINNTTNDNTNTSNHSIKSLFDKYSKLKNSSNINVLDRLNLQQLEQLIQNNERVDNEDKSYFQQGNKPLDFLKDMLDDTEKLRVNSNVFGSFYHKENKNNYNGRGVRQDADSNDVESINKRVTSWKETLFNQPISNLEKINDMHVSNTYGIPQGYSFYGGGKSLSSSATNNGSNNNINYRMNVRNRRDGSRNRTENKTISAHNGILGVYNDDSLSSEATISPVLLEPSSSGYEEMQDEMMDVDYLTGSNDKSQINNMSHKNNSIDLNSLNNRHNHYHHNHHEKLSFEEEFNESCLSGYSQIFLFTNNMARLIHMGLSEYPFFGTPTPELLPNNTLNLYIDQFVNKFLTHHPFIHKSVLNEYWLIKDSIDNALKNSISVEESVNYNKSEVKFIRDDAFVENFKDSIVCLPLLAASIGAVVSNKKDDAANLYEISRRCIHVYLESRKKLKVCGDNGSDSSSNGKSSNKNLESSPLWLIQSLTLSVIYGLFADEEISLSVIIRQVHALNSLIKSSGINQLQSPNDIEKDFKIFINYESTIRTIHMILHVSTLLSTLYNIVPSLTISDLDIQLPGATLLWECLNKDEYFRLNENFEFYSKNFKDVIQDLIKIDFKRIDPITGLVDDKNFLLENHVSEFGLICLQNGLHQLVYFKQLEGDHELANANLNSISKLTLSAVSNGIDITIDKIRQIAQMWDIIVNASVLYNKSSEVFNDCKILNYYLNLKLSSIVSLNKIKESVWLRSFSDINEQYIACFNYGDSELKDEKFQEELIHLIENSINILKLVFFNKDNSLMGKISPSFKLNNETMKKLDDIYSTPPPFSEEMNGESRSDYDSLNRINLNVLHKLSIDSQILFDVILIIVKFLTNYENFFKIRMKFNNLTNYTFLQHFELNSSVFLGEKVVDENKEVRNEEALKKFDKVLFKYYLKFFKIFLSLEQFLKHNYNYEDFETGQALEGLNNLYPNIKNNNDIEKILMENHNKLREEERTLNKVVSDELVVFHDRDLIMSELVSFKLPFKFLKMGGFLFGFIYDQNFKFVNFKHLSDVLFHLRVFLESKDDY